MSAPYKSAAASFLSSVHRTHSANNNTNNDENNEKNQLKIDLNLWAIVYRFINVGLLFLDFLCMCKWSEFVPFYRFSLSRRCPTAARKCHLPNDVKSLVNIRPIRLRAETMKTWKKINSIIFYSLSGFSFVPFKSHLERSDCRQIVDFTMRFHDIDVTVIDIVASTGSSSPAIMNYASTMDDIDLPSEIN